MPSLRQIAALTCVTVVMASGCAGVQSNADDPTVAERQPSTGTRIEQGNPAQKVDVIERDEIDATGANTVEEVLRRKGANR